MRISKPGAVAALAFAASLTLLSGTAAQAAPNGFTDNLTFAGSDTIQDVDSALTVLINRESGNTDFDRTFNVPAQFAGTVSVPGDRFCGPLTYAQSPAAGQVQAPNGSGAGRTVLNTSAGSATNAGCTDVARSSSGRAATDPTTFQYFAFARDAVGIAASSTSPAPANLTIDQIRGIYNCTITNWSQVGGGNGPIQRYLPQTGSGTRSFFISSVLANADPSATTGAGCAAVKNFQENDATTIAAGDAASAILPFSAAQFIAQANQVTLPNGSTVNDGRNGFTIRSINDKNPVTTGANGALSPNTTVYNDTTYPGARNVYHVLDTRSPSDSDAQRLVGFGFDSTDQGGISRLCNGTYSNVLTQFGFAPLPRTSNASGAACRVL